MDVTSIFWQQLTVNGGRPPIDKLQRKLYAAIKKGDLDDVRHTLSYSQAKYNLNCVNSSGKTVLQVAGDLKDVSVRNDMIKALLTGGADLELALLHAVRNSNANTVEILLPFYDQKPQQLPHALFGYITPLILAACLQNFHIVKLLLEHGFTISDPKNSWLSTNPSEKFGTAVYRLNEYRALASPVFIAASFLQNVQSGPDPVHRACVLNKELRDTAEQEYEFRKEYFKLSDGCEEFAVALLNECRTMEEIRCVMDIKNEEEMLPNLEENSLNMLEFAIITNNKKFVSHPYSQHILNSEVYKSVPFLEKSAWKQAVVILLAFALYPLVFVLWLFFYSCFPSHEVARMFHSPCVKFLIHCGTYQTFLFMLAFTSFHGDFLVFSITDWIVLVFVIGYLVDINKDIFQQGRVRFFSNYWNYLVVATVILFAIHYVIWWVGRATLPDTLLSMGWKEHAENRSYSTMLISESFMALGILLAFAQNFSFIQANYSTGPLLHAFIHMLIDVAKFSVYFVFVFLAFAVSFTKLYVQFEKARQHFGVNKMGTNQTDSLHLEIFGNSMNTIFWSLFGEIDENSFKIDVKGYGAIWKTGMTLYGALNIVAVLVALNMLIAILNECYTRTTQNLDSEWKFTRAKLWLNWIYKKGVLPPPFNILYVLLPLRWVIKRLLTACCPAVVLLFFKKLFKRKPRTTLKARRIDEQQRREVIRHLILRYLAKETCHSETCDSEDEYDHEAKVTYANHNLGTSQRSHSIVTMDTTKLVIKRNMVNKL